MIKVSDVTVAVRVPHSTKSLLTTPNIYDSGFGITASIVIQLLFKNSLNNVSNTVLVTSERNFLRNDMERLDENATFSQHRKAHASLI